MLYTIAARVKQSISNRSRSDWERDVESRLEHAPKVGNFARALARPGCRYILEFKKTSPSTSEAPLSADLASTVKTYSECGADAISILTEENYFAGSLSDLEKAHHAVRTPLLRKDFVIDKLQIAEARAYGASAILLIMALLDDDRLVSFLNYSQTLGLDALVEVHDEEELERALDVGARIIGVNNRDLKTLKIDLQSGRKLLAKIPDECIAVAESGLQSREDIEAMRDAGAKAFLIGTAIMRSADMHAKIKELMIR